MNRVYTVREITSEIKGSLEERFPFVWVQGQVSNLSRPGSGHIYFTLRDAEAGLNVVKFRTSLRRPSLTSGEPFDPLTGEVFDTLSDAAPEHYLADGKEVVCGGRLTVYPQRGVYQLVAQYISETGPGRLFLEFEELKKRLTAEGYFDAERKRELPYNPRRIALITALDSAAYHDFIRISQDRGTGAEIMVYPSLMQGEDAPAMIVRRMQQVVDAGRAQVVVIIRGGGSLEDLWAFNDERPAEAVFNSPIPVLAGIGHEVDFTITDMTADVRAATPTHAAQILWPERSLLMQEVDDRAGELHRIWSEYLLELQSILRRTERHLTLLSPQRRLHVNKERTAEASERLFRAGGRLISPRRERLQDLDDVLQKSFGMQTVQLLRQRLQEAEDGLQRGIKEHLRAKDEELERSALKLGGLDPEMPLQRGYSLVRLRKNDRFLRSVHDVLPGDAVEIRVKDGSVGARIGSGENEKE